MSAWWARNWRRLAWLLPPASEARDMLQEHLQGQERRQEAGKYLWLLTLVTIGILIVKISIYFGGNLNYVHAVLERMSMQAVIQMTATSVAFAFLLTWQLIWTTDLASRHVSKDKRGVSLLLLSCSVLYLLPMLTWLHLLVAPFTYVALRIVDHKVPWLLQRGATGIAMEDWVSVNQSHGDVVLRALARSWAKSENEEDRSEISKKILTRSAEVYTPGHRLTSSLLPAMPAFAAIVLLTPPVFSATYEAETSNGRYSQAYVLQGNNDVVVVDMGSRVPHVLDKDDLLGLRLCGPPPKTGVFATVLPVRDGTPPCSES